jgi:hypothetical protein
MQVKKGWRTRVGMAVNALPASWMTRTAIQIRFAKKPRRRA